MSRCRCRCRRAPSRRSRAARSRSSSPTSTASRSRRRSPRAAARSCTGPWSACTTVRRPSAPSRPPSSTSTAPPPSWPTHPEFAGLELDDDGVGDVPRRGRGAGRALLRARRSPLGPGDRPRDQARGQGRRAVRDPGHHRPPRARRRRRADRHRLQDRRRAPGAARALPPRRGADLRPAVRAELRSPTEAGAAPVPLDARGDHHRAVGAVDHRRDPQGRGGLQGDRPGLRNDDFRPNRSALCSYCTFKPYCPAYGGDPALAAELRGPGTVIETPLPLVTA